MYTVLLVDDEDDVTQIIMKKVPWEDMGFSVVGLANNGVKALELVEEYQPDVVMTDEGFSEAERKVRHRDQGKEKCGDPAKILYGFASAPESQLLYSTYRRVADQGAD